MRTQIFAVAIATAICGCGEHAGPAKLDQWSWLPRSAAHDAEARSVPTGTAVSYRIPAEDPLDAGSNGGWGGIDTFGNFVPTDKQSYVVKGGTLISTLGAIEKRAKYGDWDVVYADPERTKRAGWGDCLTSGRDDPVDGERRCTNFQR